MTALQLKATQTDIISEILRIDSEDLLNKIMMFIRRESKRVELSPGLMRDIAEAEKEFQKGESVLCKTPQDSINLLDSL